MSDDAEVPIQFSEDLMDALEGFYQERDNCLGWCMLCNHPIRALRDLIPGTNTHDCERGRALQSASARVREEAVTSAEFAPDLTETEPEPEEDRALLLGSWMRHRQRCRELSRRPRT